jgi:hypothetical protein
MVVVPGDGRVFAVLARPMDHVGLLGYNRGSLPGLLWRGWSRGRSQDGGNVYHKCIVSLGVDVEGCLLLDRLLLLL